MGRPKKQKNPPPESEEEEEENLQEEEDDEDDVLLSPFMGDPVDEDAHNRQILSMLKEKAEQSEGGQVLTWNALYALKQKEIDLNDKMKQQIEVLRDKYKLLKQPLFNQISDVVLGVKVDKQLYNPEGLPKAADPNKVTPRPLQDFWGQVLEKEGLLSEEADVGVFNSLVEFVCEMIDPKTNHIRIVFSFSGNDYFSNLKLEGEYFFDSQKNTPVRNLKEKINYKGDKAQHSIFTILFDPTTELGVAYNIASDVYESYSNALLCYFREDEDEEEEDEDEENEEDSEVQAAEKPKKKTKTDAKNMEKPQCKQQ